MAPEGMTVNSGADLVASVPSDIFSGIDDSPAPETTESPEIGEIETPESPDETVETVETVEDTPAEETVEEPAEEPAETEEPPAEEPKTEEELPEGVRRGKDRNGKDGLFVEPKRWERIYGDHKAVQQFSEMLGEPLTTESLDLRNRAFIGQEKLYGDLLSGDASAQAAVLQHFLDEGARAVQDGEVASDPIVSLADTFYNTIQKHPDAYAGLRHRAATDLVAELYNEAQANKSADLYRAAGWVAKTLGMPYKKDGEMQGWFASSPQENPVVGLQNRIQQLEAQLNGRNANTQAAQLEQWQNQTRQTVSTAVLDEAVKPALSEYQTGVWEKRPQSFERLVTEPLHRAVREAIKADAAFNNRIALLDQQAKRAASAQKRDAIAAQMKQAFVNRARLAAEAIRPQILKDAAATLKGQSDATHQRHQAAQNQRGPKGPAASVPRSIVPKELLPKPGETFDPAAEARRAMALINAR